MDESQSLIEIIEALRKLALEYEPLPGDYEMFYYGVPEALNADRGRFVDILRAIPEQIEGAAAIDVAKSLLIVIGDALDDSVEKYHEDKR